MVKLKLQIIKKYGEKSLYAGKENEENITEVYHVDKS
jgi:hypothetical protein